MWTGKLKADETALKETVDYISHEAGSGRIYFFCWWRLSLLLFSEVTALSRCLSGEGELHGGCGCGFKCDKSQRGEEMRSGSRDKNRKTYNAAKIHILWKVLSACPVAWVAARIRVLVFQQLEYFFFLWVLNFVAPSRVFNLLGWSAGATELLKTNVAKKFFLRSLDIFSTLTRNHQCGPTDWTTDESLGLSRVRNPSSRRRRNSSLSVYDFRSLSLMNGLRHVCRQTSKREVALLNFNPCFLK